MPKQNLDFRNSYEEVGDYVPEKVTRGILFTFGPRFDTFPDAETSNSHRYIV